MSLSLKEISSVVQAAVAGDPENVIISDLLTDSRKSFYAPGTLFFALDGEKRKGADFIPELQAKGLKYFVVPKSVAGPSDGNCVVLTVDDVLAALQQTAAYHRGRIGATVTGITGSNGKTIVKEWLYGILQSHRDVYRSPKSYNSQIGVPLSVWQIPPGADDALIEAGISRRNEMQKLEQTVRPDIGIFTSIGAAHDEGFANTAEKIWEKLQLFSRSGTLVFPAVNPLLPRSVFRFRETVNPQLKLYTWGHDVSCDLWLQDVRTTGAHTLLTGTFHGHPFRFDIPFRDTASIENAMTCACYVLCCTDISMESLAQSMNALAPVSMRLEVKQGRHLCSIINDGYSADLTSLRLALDFLGQQGSHQRHSLVLSDFLQTGLDSKTLYETIAALLRQHHLFRLIGVGEAISEHKELFKDIPRLSFYDSTDRVLDNLSAENFYDETVLLKGARKFGFERLGAALEQKVHQTVMSVNLDALRHNLNVYKGLLQQGTGIMCMVKASGYGSGSFETAHLLQHAGVKYLAVAYTDEGVELRHAGIRLPIMVMNAEPTGFSLLTELGLEPEIYSFSLLREFAEFTGGPQKSFPVHLKIDTGMHRLGFMPDEAAAVAAFLQKNPQIKIASVFSHLAGSDDPAMDGFSLQQYSLLQNACDQIENAVGYKFLRHIANTSAIGRLPMLQMDMVRLGIGLYGVDANMGIRRQLQNVNTLTTTIAQIKTLKAGDTVGYNRLGKISADTAIATVRIGYADGYRRSLGNGRGYMSVNGKKAPVVGNVCMDMTMIDITGIGAEEGDEVTVFGRDISLSELANMAGTIPYEILTSISQRVKRIYYAE